MLLSFLEAANACDLVTLLIDDGVSIGFESRMLKGKTERSVLAGTP